MNLLRGYEGVWIQARRNNTYYILNKLLSICIAAICAYVTLSFKRTTQIYNKQIEDQEAAGTIEATKEAYHCISIYWIMFIYYSLAAMDEMIELFSVMNQLEKGALGLFFEMNYFIGVYLAGYIAWFVHKYKAPVPVNEENTVNFNKMYNWLLFQYFYLYFAIILMAVVTYIYARMNGQAKNLRHKSHQHEEIEMKDRSGNYAIN